MKNLAISVALAGALALPLAAAAPPSDPRTLGPVVAREVAVRQGKVVLRVDSGGCTDKRSLKATVKREKGPGETTLHYYVTFERVRSDDCKAMLLDGVELEYDLAGDLGIRGDVVVSVTNPVAAVGSPPAAGAQDLAGGLLAATVKALEMELKGYEERLKTAQRGVGPPENVAKYTARVAEVKGWLDQYRAMSPSQYTLPGPDAAPTPELDTLLKRYGPEVPAVVQKVKATVKEALKEGSTLEVEGMTKSGPFFHVAGGDLSKLEVGRTYEMTLYRVYRREYVGTFPSEYVYIADAK